MRYADEMELGPDLRDFLWEVVRKVDAAFLNFLNEKMTKEMEQAKQAAKAKEQPRG
jgi:hypothetical protein